MKKHILFVCKYNRFRSQLAAGFFQKSDTKNRFKVTSAGVIKGGPVSRDVKLLAAGYGIRLSEPKGLERNALRKQNIIVIVANDVPISIFKHLKKWGIDVIQWKIKDVRENATGEIRSVAEVIRRKIETFHSQLGK
jgi:protein-tyrosine-phosphatase